MSSKPVPRIHYVSAPCSSGKTYATCQFIRRHKHESNHLYVAPTIDLLEETAETLERMGVYAITINSRNSSISVKRAIVERLKASQSKGDVLLITLSSFLDLPDFNRKENWQVYVDEIPQIDRFFPIDLHQNRDHLAHYVKVGDLLNEGIHEVQRKKKGRIKHLLENPDDITKQLRPLYRDLTSPHRDIYVDQFSWNKFENNNVTKEKDSNRVYFLSMLNPKVFDGAIMLGANFEHSLFYKWATGPFHNVEFVQHEEIVESLRFKKHPENVGQRLCITYLLKDRGYSKTLSRQKIDGSDELWRDRFDEEVIKEFGEKEFIYAANNDYNGKLLDLRNAMRMKTISHGLNKYHNETRCYFGPALNRTSQHRKMLNNLGFENPTIKNSTLYEATYQGIMRTALRDPDSKEIVYCIVPERDAAGRLIEIFNGAKAKFVGNDDFKWMKPLTQAQRNKRNRFFKKWDEKLGVNNGISEWGGDNHHLHRNDYDSPIRSTKENSNQIDAELIHSHDSHVNENNRSGACGADGCADSEAGCANNVISFNFHGSVFDKEKDSFFGYSWGVQDFIGFMREASGLVVKSKDELFLLNPATYNGDTESGYRQLVNFDQSPMMVLDFDNGDLSIEEFERIFWKEAGSAKRSFITCNSFSRNAKQPNRFRVMMFYKSPVRGSIELHRAIYDSIVSRLAEHGYTESCSGLDKNCRNGNQSFYIPCINQRYPDYAYFKQWGTSTPELERYAIDPELVMKTMVRKAQKPMELDWSDGEIQFDRSVGKEDQIDRIKDMVRRLSEGRRDPFFKAGVLLFRNLRLPMHEVQYHLEELEREIGKEKDKWAKGVVDTLRKS